VLGAGTVINPIIKIVTTVAILAAVYFFIVKPTLDTTNNAFDSVSSSFSGFGNLDDNIQSQIDNAFNSTSGNTDQLQNCIQHAINNGADAQQINRCVSRFSP
jgi:phage-related protein